MIQGINFPIAAYIHRAKTRHEKISFKGNEDLLNYKDEFNGGGTETFGKTLRLWDLRASRAPLTQFFLATPEHLSEQGISMVREHLGIEAPPVEIPLDKGLYVSIVRPLLENKGNIKKILDSAGEKVLVVVRGFEEKVKKAKDYSRAAHDLNQDLAQDNIDCVRKIFKDKKLVLLFPITDKLGEEVYRRSLLSACNSQFRDGLAQLVKR